MSDAMSNSKISHTPALAAYTGPTKRSQKEKEATNFKANKKLSITPDKKLSTFTSKTNPSTGKNKAGSTIAKPVNSTKQTVVGSKKNIIQDSQRKASLGKLATSERSGAGAQKSLALQQEAHGRNGNLKEGKSGPAAIADPHIQRALVPFKASKKELVDENREISKKGDEVITVLFYVWKFIQKYHKSELESFKRNCTIKTGKKDKYGTCKLVLKPHNGSHVNGIAEFTSLYEDVKSKVTTINTDKPSDKSQLLVEQLENKFKCAVVNQAPSGLLIICLSTDQKDIEGFLKKDMASSGNPAITALSFQPRGYQIHQSMVILHQCDITSLKVDAITNPANLNLRPKGGLFKIIADSAGGKFEYECQQIMVRRRGKKLGMGEVVRTSGGQLAAKYVYHVSGPMWPGDKCSMDKQTEFTHKLQLVCLNVMEAARKDNVISLAIPPMSSGAYGAPLHLLAEAVVTSIIESSTNKSSLKEIHLVDISLEFLSKADDLLSNVDAIEDISQTKLRNLLKRRLATAPEYLTNKKSDNSQLENSPFPTPRSPKVVPSLYQTSTPPTTSYMNVQRGFKLDSSLAKQDSGTQAMVSGDKYNAVPSDDREVSKDGTDKQSKPLGMIYRNRTNIFVHACNMTKLKVDAIVNPANKNLVSVVGLSSLIENAAGSSFKQECIDFVRKYGILGVGEVHTMPAQELPAKFVIHAVGPVWSKSKEYDCLKHLSTTFDNIMEEARRQSIDSIAIPPIGTGIFGIPTQKVVPIMCDRILRGLKANPTLKEVHLVDISVDTVALIKSELYNISVSNIGRNALRNMDFGDVVSALKPSIVEPSDDSGSPKTDYMSLSEENGFREGTGAGAIDEIHKRQQQRVDQINENGGRIFGLKEPSRNLSNFDEKEHDDPGGLHAGASPPKEAWTSHLTSSEANPTSNKGPVSKPIRLKRSGDAMPKTVTYNLGPTDRYHAQDTDNDEMLSDDDLIEDRNDHGDNSLAHQKQSNIPKTCIICLYDIEKPKTLPRCGHTFCEKCIDLFFKYKPICIICGERYGVDKGVQPRNGIMNVTRNQSSLPGHERHGTIIIQYDFPSGTQGPEHPHPGHNYSGISCTAYLPDTPEGRNVLALLKKAFDARLIFTIGRSVRTDFHHALTWNGIHHKTSTHGGSAGFGYPDQTYLDQVKKELAAKGIE